VYEQLGVAAAGAGVLATPLMLKAVRWAPASGRPPSAAETLPAAPPPLLVAILTGVVLGLIGARIGLEPALPAYLVFGAVASVLALVDVAHHRLPDILTLPSYLVGAALLGFAALAGSSSGSLGRALLGAAVGFGTYAVLFVIAPAGIGAGDVKYAGVVGMHAGWLGWGPLLIALVSGFVVGALVSVALMMRGRAGLKTKLPFGPAMVAGAVIAVVWGDPLATAWLG